LRRDSLRSFDGLCRTTTQINAFQILRFGKGSRMIGGVVRGLQFGETSAAVLRAFARNGFMKS
jgi:hypothetical protein